MNLLKPDEGYQQELNAHINEAAKTDKVPLPYWRAALAEVSLQHPKVSAESKPVEIGYFSEAWRITAAEPDVTTWTTAKFAASKARSDGKPANLLPFLLIPARLSEMVGHGIKRRAGNIHEGLTVLCIPCLLDRNGCLWPDPDRHPWIPRNLLEPTLESIAIGHLDDYDKFMSNLPERAVSFGDTLETASKLFEAVTGTRLPSLPISSNADEIPPVFAIDGYELVSTWHGILGEQSVPAIHLIKLYDQIISEKQNFPLLDNLRTIGDRPSRQPVPIQESEQSYSSIVGHINRQHPLSPTQREAMVELALLGKGQVLAVNGPPGTGKTTLLQSVVAQLWVEAALKESKCPLIVVTSTNVKAVENVLKDFVEICAETGHRRWHPYGGGFGLFLASESRESKYPTCTSKSHPYSEYETAEAVESAEEFFLRQASAWFKQEQNSVADVVKTLHVQLKHFEQKLKHSKRHLTTVWTGTAPWPTMTE